MGGIGQNESRPVFGETWKNPCFWETSRSKKASLERNKDRGNNGPVKETGDLWVSPRVRKKETKRGERTKKGEGGQGSVIRVDVGGGKKTVFVKDSRKTPSRAQVKKTRGQNG